MMRKDDRCKYCCGATKTPINETVPTNQINRLDVEVGTQEYV